MERFHDVFDHPHELIIHEEWDHALCHKVANDRRSVAETEWKRCRGTPYVVFRRERLSSGEPRHVFGIREGEAAQVLLGWLGSQGDTELALKPPVVEADGGKRLNGSVSQCQLFSHRDDEVQVSEAHVCTRDPADTVASHLWPNVSVGMRKGPLPGAPTVGVLSKHQLVNLYLLRVGPGWCAKRHKVYIGSGRMSLCPVCCCCSCY